MLFPPRHLDHMLVETFFLLVECGLFLEHPQVLLHGLGKHYQFHPHQVLHGIRKEQLQLLRLVVDRLFRCMFLGILAMMNTVYKSLSVYHIRIQWLLFHH